MRPRWTESRFPRQKYKVSNLLKEKELLKNADPEVYPAASEFRFSADLLARDLPRVLEQAFRTWI
jgi:hypothetical protein